jgi:hypothetical protein
VFQKAVNSSLRYYDFRSTDKGMQLCLFMIPENNLKRVFFSDFLQRSKILTLYKAEQVNDQCVINRTGVASEISWYYKGTICVNLRTDWGSHETRRTGYPAVRPKLERSIFRRMVNSIPQHSTAPCTQRASTRSLFTVMYNAGTFILQLRKIKKIFSQYVIV